MTYNLQAQQRCSGKDLFLGERAYFTPFHSRNYLPNQYQILKE